MAKQAYVLIDGQWVETGGPPGPGVPKGGTVGQTLTKSGTADYATSWTNPVVVKSTTPPSDLTAIWIDINP